MKYLLRLLAACLLFAISVPPISAQETGFMLKFNKVPNLRMRIENNFATSAGDSVAYESAISEKSPAPFNRVLFNGTIADSNFALQARARSESGKWSAWRDVYIKRFPGGRFWARLDLPEGKSTRQIQYRLLNRGVSLPAQIEIYAVEGIDIKAGAGGGEAPPRKNKEDRLRFSLADTIPKPAVVSRAQWGAKPPIGVYVPHDPYRFAQHHTAGRRVSTLADGIAEQKFIQDFHQNGRGWQDIGYHFTVDDSGRVYEGVPPQFRGTHTGGNNTGNIGISYMGNFEIPGEQPTQKAIDSLERMWSWLSFEFGVNPDSLFGHRDYKATACPGSNFYPKLPEMRNSVRKQLGFGSPYVALPQPQPFTREVPATTGIQFSIRDDEEGVDINSVVVRVDNQVALPSLSGGPSEITVAYQPPQAFASAQTVVVEVEANDLAQPPNVLRYSYKFTTEVEALHAEVETASTMRNANLEIQGQWQTDPGDVSLTKLTNGQRLIAQDNDGSHRVRVFPAVQETGDYKVLLASNTKFLGESARYRFVTSSGAHPIFIEYNTPNFRKWGSLSPTPVQFRGAGDTSAYIELSGLSNVPTRLVLDALRLEKVDPRDPPHAPVLKWVRVLDKSTKEIDVAWYPSLEGDIAGYRLFMSEDGRAWGAPLVDEQTLGPNTDSYQLNYAGSGATLYFQLVGVDTNTVEVEGQAPEPLLSAQTDIYGVGLKGSRKILIVDNFDRLASWRLLYHPFVRTHGEALDANNQGFDSCAETAVQNGEIQLSDYDLVVYFCGDDSRADESLAAADQFRLLDYMKSGGKLFISGSEIGYDFDATTATELGRYHDLLKATYVGDLSGSNRVLGSGGTVFDGLDFVYGTVQSSELYIEDFPDYIVPRGGSQVALSYDNLRIAAVSFSGFYSGGAQPAQLVYLGFTFETIVNSADRADLMARALRYFDFPTAVTEEQTVVPERYALHQNYPNPFNPSTTIEYELPAGAESQSVKLEIFNTLGQKVKTLVDGKQRPGRRRVSWSGRTDRGLPVASGIYVYRLSVGAFVSERKMLFLR